MDWRIAIYLLLKFNKISVILSYLTYYRQLETSASKNFQTFSRIGGLEENKHMNIFLMSQQN